MNAHIIAFEYWNSRKQHLINNLEITYYVRVQTHRCTNLCDEEQRCVLVLKLCIKKLMKGKVLRKHSLHEKTAASVLLKLFISGNE